MRFPAQRLLSNQAVGSYCPRVDFIGHQVAQFHHVNVTHHHLLVGCKYIALVMRALETEGRFGSVQGCLEDVLIGTEESHGFLISPNMRDKDGATPALILAEFASREKRRGRSLLSALDDLFHQHGAVGVGWGHA